MHLLPDVAKVNMGMVNVCVFFCFKNPPYVLLTIKLFVKNLQTKFHCIQHAAQILSLNYGLEEPEIWLRVPAETVIFLGAFAKLLKGALSFVMSVRPVSMEHFGFQCTDFGEMLTDSFTFYQRYIILVIDSVFKNIKKKYLYEKKKKF